MSRILLLVKGLNRGGTEQLLLNAAPFLVESKFDYEIAYLLRSTVTMRDLLRDAGLTLHCLDAEQGRLAWTSRLRTLVRHRSIDLIHTHSPYPAAVARSVITASPAPRFVHTEHAPWDSYHRATYWANLLTFWRNAHVFAVSRYVLDSISYPKLLRPLRKPPAEVLYQGLRDAGSPVEHRNGVRDELGIASDAPVVGVVANFTPQKAHRFVLDAVASVRAVLPDVRLVLVGNGPLEGDIRRYASERGLDDTVVFAGYRTDAPRIASAFDVFALSSMQEGLSIALIEGMANGIPAVVTDVGGLPEVVRSGREGFVVARQNPSEMASALTRLLRDVSLRRGMGEAARVRARDFDIRRTVDRTEDVYRSLIR